MTIFITGTERSGTTVYRELLCSTGYLNADEIFHGVLNNKYRFFDYVYQKVLLDKSYIFPIYHRDFFYNFIDHLQSLGFKNVVADVKYQDYSLLNSSYLLKEERPFFIEYLQITNYPVIHLIRKNKLQLLTSKLLAESTGVYSINDDILRPKINKPLEMDCTNLVDKITKLIEKDSEVSVLLSGVTHKFELFYEEMFDESGNFSKKAIAIAEEACSDSGFNPNPILVKVNNSSLGDIFSNFCDIQKSLSGTDYEWMMNEI
jgi:hypothetical protein